MLTRVIQAYLAKRLPPSPAWRFTLAELAAAALMVECARIDGEFTPEERGAICRAVQEQLTLDEETAGCLVAVAVITIKFGKALGIGREESSGAEKDKRSGLADLARNRYFLLMAAMAIFLSLGSSIVDFSFLSEVRL